jgi:hypothetical protein
MDNISVIFVEQSIKENCLNPDNQKKRTIETFKGKTENGSIFTCHYYHPYTDESGEGFWSVHRSYSYHRELFNAARKKYLEER